MTIILTANGEYEAPLSKKNRIFFFKFDIDTLTTTATRGKIYLQFVNSKAKGDSWSKILYEKYEVIYISERIKDELIMTLTSELPVLRARLGVSQEKMASSIGVSRQTYSAIETKTKKMSWTMFMALIAVLDLNEATSVMLDQIPDFIQTIRGLTENN